MLYGAGLLGTNALERLERRVRGVRQAASTGLESYGLPGPGRWITVYANNAHAWIVVAGIALDTADHGGPGIPAGTGPRWRAEPLANLRDGTRYVVRHPPGFVTRRAGQLAWDCSSSTPCHAWAYRQIVAKLAGAADSAPGRHRARRVSPRQEARQAGRLPCAPQVLRPHAQAESARPGRHRPAYSRWPDPQPSGRRSLPLPQLAGLRLHQWAEQVHRQQQARPRKSIVPYCKDTLDALIVEIKKG